MSNHSFIHALSTYCVPDTLPGTRDIIVNKTDKNPGPHRADMY
jgi:hypothetical protein